MSDYYTKPVSKFLANHPRTRNLLGLFTGRLIVLEWVGRNKWGNALWLCACACGNTKVIAAAVLTPGAVNPTESCGCLAADKCRERATTHGETCGSTHGKSRSPEIIAYGQAKARCTQLNRRDASRYMQRGIKFLFTSFEQFLAEVGRRPSTEHSLDRYPNKDGNYEPGNVRWATRMQQVRNKNNTLLITAQGKTQSTAEWSAETGIGQNCLWGRKRQRGWCDECTVRPDLKRCEHRVLPAQNAMQGG